MATLYITSQHLSYNWKLVPFACLPPVFLFPPFYLSIMWSMDTFFCYRNPSTRYTVVVVHSLSRVWLFCIPMHCRVLRPWDSPGKNTGVGCHFLLQRIFMTQGSNLCLLCLLHWQAGFFFFFFTWEALSQQLTCIILSQSSLVSRSQQETKGVLELGS